MGYQFLLDIGLIILVVKIFTLITQKIKIPRFLGGLFAGILLGPSMLNLVHHSGIIEVFTTLGIIFIMFLAGMETNLKSYFKNARKYFLIAALGILVPLILGFLTSTIYVRNFDTNLFLGIVLTSTSVSITVEALMQINKLHTKIGMAILGAGVADDIIGIIFLSLIMSNEGLSLKALILTLSSLLIFFIIAAFIGIIIFKIFEILERSNKNNDKIPTFSIAYALILAYFAEKLGISGVIGAYIAGVVIGNTPKGSTIKSQIEVPTYLIFAPVFFASMGLKLTSFSFPFHDWIFIILFATIAILGKVIGNGFGAKLCGYTKQESIRIGIGMATRGEITLVMLDKALQNGLINNELFSMILVSILIVTIIIPVLLQQSLKKIKAEEE